MGCFKIFLYQTHKLKQVGNSLNSKPKKETHTSSNTTESVADSTRKDSLQSGQLDWVLSHRSTQSEWNLWSHLGKTLTLSPSSKTPKQIQHSISSSLPTVDLWWRIIGIDLIATGSNPRQTTARDDGAWGTWG